MASLDLEGRAVALEPGDTVASALFRAGVRVFSRSFKYHRPRGLYCLTGDCPHCLVTVDGEPGMRACVTPAVAGMRVVRENAWPSPERDLLSALRYAKPLLPVGFYYKTLVRPGGAWPRVEPLVRRLAGLGRPELEPVPEHREAVNHHCDVLVVGAGAAGLEAAAAAAGAGQSVVLCDEGPLDERPAHPGVVVLERAAAIGIYEGPLVPVSADDFLHLVHPARVVVATGAVERHAVFPGSDLPGVWLGRGAARLARVHGLLPGRRVVFAGATEESREHVEALRSAGAQVTEVGTVLGARGRTSVRKAVVETDGVRRTLACDAIVVSLGLVPRDALLRQGAGLPVEAVGDAAADPEPAPAASAGFVCPCEDVEVRDLEQAWREGFRSTELLKRYTTATMGPCQGALCHAHLRGFVRARGGAGLVAAATTARPPARPIRLEDAAGGVHFAIEQRTALHERHLELGATMEWAGAWKRPETYGDPLAEYWAVRRAVSAMDVGTLGKFLVAGPDATAFLERIYPCHVRDLEEGRLRYTLVLNEAGYVFDDGLVCSLGDDGYYLTFTSGGAEQAEAWLRDWAETWGYDVHLVNRTAALGAINVAGPRSRELLARLTRDPIDKGSFPYLRHRELEVAGVRCRAFRLGFVGELGYELHHPSSESVRLWDALLDAGEDFELRPHGLEALRLLRLEKGHIIVGQDTDFDTTPAKLGLGWAVRMEKDDFVGRTALARMASLPLEQRLVPIAFPQAPVEGTPLSLDGSHVGHLTSSRFSPVLGHGVALGWVRGAGAPARVVAEGAAGDVVEHAFYDPEGARLRA